MAFYTYLNNLDPHDSTGELILRGGDLVIYKGQYADITTLEYTTLAKRFNLGAGKLGTPAGPTQAGLHDLLTPLGIQELIDLIDSDFTTELANKADLVSGKVPVGEIPAVALIQVVTVASQAAQLALTAQQGDVAVRSDQNRTYIHNGGTAGTMADWTQLPGGTSSGGYTISSQFSPDPTGAVDATAAFNSALATGSVLVDEGLYQINGIVDIDPQYDFLGVGPNVVFRLGVSGQLRCGQRTVDTAARGGTVGGFTVNGNGVNNIAGGGFYVGYNQKRTFRAIEVSNCIGDNIVVETAQNCIFESINSVGAGRSCLVLDYGTGGNNFYGMETANPGMYGIEIRQTGPSPPGVYSELMGPSGNTWVGGIAEYGSSADALIYHGAGSNNRFISYGVVPVGAPSYIPGVKMEVAANARSTTATIVSGSNDITVASPTGIYPLMSGNVPGFPRGTPVAAVVGNVVTMFSPATSSHGAGTAVSFGAASNSLEFNGITNIGTDSISAGFELGEFTDITLTGRSYFGNHAVIFRTYASAKVDMQGPELHYDNTIGAIWEQHPSDTAAATTEDRIVRSRWMGGMTITAPNDSAAFALEVFRRGETQPRTVVGQGGINFGDGVAGPYTVGIGRSVDATDGLEYLLVLPGMMTPYVKTTGVGAATVGTRFFGRRTATGPPTVGPWLVGDFLLDSAGALWMCSVSGTPGTWVGGGGGGGGAVTTVAGRTGDVVLVKSDVGLGNVDNTSDVNKPVSTSQQTALDLKANLASPSLTGNPTAPTPTAGDNDTSIATTAFVANALAGVGGGSSTISISVKTATYTPTLADMGTVIEVNSLAPVAIVIDTDVSKGFSSNHFFMVRQVGLGQVSFSPVSGAVTLRGSLTTRAQWSTISAHRRAANEWVTGGDTT